MTAERIRDQKSPRVPGRTRRIGKPPASEPSTPWPSVRARSRHASPPRSPPSRHASRTMTAAAPPLGSPPRPRGPTCGARDHPGHVRPCASHAPEPRELGQEPLSRRVLRGVDSSPVATDGHVPTRRRTGVLFHHSTQRERSLRVGEPPSSSARRSRSGSGKLASTLALRTDHV